MGCASFARFILLAFNILFFIVGGVSLGLGIWVVVDKKSLLDNLNVMSADVATYNIASILASAAYIFLVSGAIIFFISFLGCCGAWKKNSCLLVTYGIIVLLIVMLEIAVIVLANFFSNKVDGQMTTGLQQTITSNYNSQLTYNNVTSAYVNSIGNAETLAWDIVQIELSCCGVTSGGDYLNATAWNRTIINVNGSQMLIPASCCRLNNGGSIVDGLKAKTTGILQFANTSCPVTAYDSYTQQGCYNAVKSLIKSNSTAVLAISASILAVQVLLVIFAFCYARLAKAGKD